MKTISISGKKLGFKKYRPLKNVTSIKNYLYQKKSVRIEESTNEIKECYLKTLDDIKTAELFEYHRSIAERQRLQFEKDKKNIASKSIMILCDWKEKIKIGKKYIFYFSLSDKFVSNLGMGPRQISQEFYSQEQRTLLGFCCFYRDENNIIQKKYFDIISDHLKQTAYVVIKSFRYIQVF